MNKSENIDRLHSRKHPKGLYLLFTLEMWERFSYYGMRGILMLYLTKSFIEGGLAIDAGTASLIYGFYTGFVYFTPLIGGWLADRYLGQRKAINIGALAMMFGQITLFALNSHAGLYCGLILLILGNGFFKPNISTLVGKLYDRSDPKRDSAFSIFYMGVNLGAFLAPLITGLLSDNIFATKNEAGEIVAYGYRYGFLAAGAGMLLGQTIFAALAKKYLGKLGLSPEGARLYVGKKEKPAREKLTSAEKQRIGVIFIFLSFSIFFWAGFEQAGSSLTLYTDNYIDRTLVLPRIGQYTIPVAWFQSTGPLFVVLLAPLFGMFWVSKIGRRMPVAVKMGSGMVILGVGFFFMLAAVAQRGGDIDDTSIKASMWWLVFTYFVHTMGELCLSPVGLSVVTKLSPPKFASLLMAVWLSALFFANILAGLLASHVETLGAGKIFLLISVFVIICGFTLIALNRQISRMMNGVK
ncbi:MAG: peptide MFS transporter [Prevotellaceae bacterium]|jgi:POT family proton-dependent oligopeptide transporter|nr:peptide MFS transporter [Prevotellaceae bacterium]